LTSDVNQNTGKGSASDGFCQSPQSPSRYVLGVLVPVQCFAVQLVVHRRPGGDSWCYSVEVSDPHTRELLAHVVDPSRRFLTDAQMASFITTDLRGLLLELTDPDPF